MAKFLLAFFLVGHLGLASVQVVTSTPDLAWAVKEIGADKVQVQSLLKGKENPHYVDAVPEFIRLVSNAQLVCLVGLDLEVGWMPKVLSKSGNAAVQPGGKGYCETGKTVDILEKPTQAVDRSLGDVHPAGNPHFWIGPRYLKQGARTIRDGLVAVDPANTNNYLQGYAHLERLLDSIEKENRLKLVPYEALLKQPVLIEYHKEFAYFLETYQLRSLGSIEEKPGVPPSAGRLAQMAIAAKQAQVKFILATDTAPKQTLERFSELSGLPVITVPISLFPAGGFSDYAKLQAHIIDQMIQSLSQKVKPIAYMEY